jgi:endonuclease/exonuclease/phosphatase family metal-dependent hydrolase
MINEPVPARSLRVMTFNIRGLHDDAAAVTQVLRETGPDVVSVQEPPRGPFARLRLRRVAEAAGLEVAVQGGGARTTALLVRAGVQVTGRRAIGLPWRGRTRRGMAVGDVAGVRVISLHLGLSANERARHARRLHTLVTSAPAGVVVAGDFNEPPGGPVRRRLGLHLRDLTPGSGPTFPASRPTQRIDAVLGSAGLVPSGARAVGGDAARRASDHLPVVVDLQW